MTLCGQYLEGPEYKKNSFLLCPIWNGMKILRDPKSKVKLLISLVWKLYYNIYVSSGLSAMMIYLKKMEVNYFKQFYFDYDSEGLKIEIVLPFTLTDAPGIMGFILECFSKKIRKAKN